MGHLVQCRRTSRFNLVKQVVDNTYGGKSRVFVLMKRHPEAERDMVEAGCGRHPHVEIIRTDRRTIIVNILKYSASYK
jgi:hypothetical protein